MCYVAVGGEADFEDVAEASHLKGLEATDLGTRCPTFGTVEKCWKAGCLEDSDFGFDGYLGALVEDGFEAPEAVCCFLEAGSDFGFDVWGC